MANNNFKFATTLAHANLIEESIKERIKALRKEMALVTDPDEKRALGGKTLELEAIIRLYF